MPRTNVDYYMTGFDAAGKRVGSLICDFDPDKNPKKLAALKEKAAEFLLTQRLSKLRQPRTTTCIWKAMSAALMANRFHT